MSAVHALTSGFGLRSPLRGHHVPDESGARAARPGRRPVGLRPAREPAHRPRYSASRARLVPTREDAEDVVQDAFLSAMKAIGSFDVSRPFGPWITRIVVNQGITFRRSRARAPG
jgi:hypothetical protein